ncbi:MAG: response regulator, partial [Clostridiales bacterium]|nr:response regulator [Clostridiales bacterium]
AATVPVDELLQNSAQVLSEGVVVEELCMKNAQDNSETWYRLVINPPQGKSGYMLMLFDRTKERRMRADLEAALTIAKSANEAKSNFLSNMSHDIRTPMNAIIGFATLLEKDAENPDKVRDYIRKISFSSHHMLSLINDILDMSKIESGKSALHIEEFALPDMLEEIYTIISTQVASKQQKFEMHTKGAIPELVNGDRLRLNQVMINLLSNAVKYTPVGGEIDLTVEALPESVRNHAHLRFIVKDNGLGMSEEFVKVIFEPFSRETTAYTKEIQGTGLGMAITKQIVDLMGGTISVKSKLNEGSEFIVEIELAKITHTYKDVKEFWTKHNIRRMLVVDDEKDVCIEVKELMRDTGVKVDYATGGQEALEILSKKQSGKTKYDIVLLDWKMPEMDGLETAKRMHENIDSQLPIMVLTSYNFEEIADEAKKTGINVFLSKPFFVSNFRNAVAKLQDAEEEKDEDVEEASLEGLNILAAEDNPINAEILEELLDIEGATCTICENGKVAVETFEKSAPGTYSMIFMDVQMPVMNGHEASKAIRASSHPEAKTIPIIAMTANAFDDDKKMAYDAGMNAHVAKPIDMSVLKKTVAKLR